MFMVFFYQYIQKVELMANGLFMVSIKPDCLYFLGFVFSKSLLFKFRVLALITCVDRISYKKRFELVYNFLNVTNNVRLFLVVGMRYMRRYPFTVGVVSLMSIYKSAAWMEREVWDMYGVFFKYHDDLRRILTDYGFKGFPLRKEFPLTGYLQIRFDDTRRMIVYEKVKLSQEFRVFSFINPWVKDAII